MGFIGGKLINYLVNLGLSAGKNHFESHINEKKLKESLESYIQKQKKYNEISSLDEEIDFQSVMEYIQNKLIDEVENRLFDTNPKIRGKARKQIISKALAVAKASDKKASKKVKRIISTSIDIIRDFYKNGIDKQLYLISEEIVDTVNEKIDDSTNVLQSEINALNRNMKYSPENMMELAKKGDFEELNELFSHQFSAVSEVHPLKGYYSFERLNGIIVSKPLSQEAIEKYPPRILFNGTVKIGEQHVSSVDSNLFNYADRHQLKIGFNVEKAVKLLGGIVDPCQMETNSLQGKELIRYPKPFPPATPCKISIENSIICDYVELRIEEILDDGTYIISNKEQNNTNFRYTIKCNQDPSKKFDFTVALNNATTLDLLNHSKIMKALSYGGKLKIYALDLNCNFIEGNFDPYVYKPDFGTIDQEIDFLERVYMIEKYYKKANIICREDIYQSDYDKIYYLSELIQGKNVNHPFNGISFEVFCNDESKERINAIGSNIVLFKAVQNKKINIFNVDFEVKVVSIFNSIRLKDYDRISNIVSLLNSEEKVKLTFDVVEDSMVIECLYNGDDKAFNSNENFGVKP